MLPHFVNNRRDPLWPLSDGACQKECFQRQLLATLPRRMRGAGGLLGGPFTYASLTTEMEDPYYAYNSLQLRTACPEHLPGTR